jgi:hypothetical protein
MRASDPSGLEMWTELSHQCCGTISVMSSRPSTLSQEAVGSTSASSGSTVPAATLPSSSLARFGRAVSRSCSLTRRKVA